MPLSFQHINHSFGSKTVLHDVSLDVADGERVGILGPSGGGKTTLLNIAAGLLRPDSGEVQSSYDRVSFVFQEYRLLPWLTAAENITAAAGCSRETALALLNALELGGEEDSYPDSLSGGMQQRVNIARALAYSSDMVLMDEPFKGLDEELRGRVIEQVDTYLDGRTLLLVTHDRRECEWLKCTKIIEFDE